MDRNLLGDLGSWAAALGAHATHGISETHVLHHVSSKIPHYNAWEATDALRKVTNGAGLKLQGAPGGWSEVYRVFKECKVRYLDCSMSDFTPLLIFSSL
jgi:omega-6 fatty acid desaturase / acyl-lipid omega-6 desaturase (Delta-12 desaturase)